MLVSPPTGLRKSISWELKSFVFSTCEIAQVDKGFAEVDGPEVVSFGAGINPIWFAEVDIL